MSHPGLDRLRETRDRSRSKRSQAGLWCWRLQKEIDETRQKSNPQPASGLIEALANVHAKRAFDRARNAPH
jgi:hypothetical protein